MVLNNLSQNFAIWVDPSFIYQPVIDTWMPIIRRQKFAYVTLNDFIISQLTSISFPSVQAPGVTQGQQNYQLTKRPGRQLDHLMSKTFTLTFKLSESYLTYFICRQQFDYFLRFGQEYASDLYMPPLSVTILDDGGFEIITYTYNELTPINISDFDLSYSSRPGTFNTFTWEFAYNYFDIYYKDDRGHREKISTSKEFGMLKDPGIIDINKISEYSNIISSQTAYARNNTGREPRQL